MKKPHLITAGLLALAAIAAAQATTVAQSLIRVLEIAGEVQVSARDGSIANTINWAPQVVCPSAGVVGTAVWFVPSGYKARIRFARDTLSNNARAKVTVGQTEIDFPTESDLVNANYSGLVLDAGDSLAVRYVETASNNSYPLTASFLFTIELVEI
jgi:hypothetical protein